MGRKWTRARASGPHRPVLVVFPIPLHLSSLNYSNCHPDCTTTTLSPPVCTCALCSHTHTPAHTLCLPALASLTDTQGKFKHLNREPPNEKCLAHLFQPINSNSVPARPMRGDCAQKRKSSECVAAAAAAVVVVVVVFRTLKNSTNIFNFVLLHTHTHRVRLMRIILVTRRLGLS